MGLFRRRQVNLRRLKKTVGDDTAKIEYQKTEKTFSYFIGVWRFTFLHFNGTYDGVAFAPNPYRNEKCNDFCFYSVFVTASNCICEFPIL